MKRRWWIAIAILGILVACLFLAANKQHAPDDLRFLKPYASNDSHSYGIQDPTLYSPAYYNEEHAVELKGETPDQIMEILISHFKKGEWQCSNFRMKEIMLFTASKMTGHFRGVGVMPDTIQFQSGPLDSGLQVTERHGLTKTEIFFVRLTHLGRNPFTKHGPTP